MNGVKHDGGKAPWHLLPFDAVRCIVAVLAFGAGKYAERNWEQGMDWSRVFGALMRHLTAWWEGERKDPETGMSHLWHAGCCVLFLIAYELRGAGRDDRPGALTGAQALDKVSMEPPVSYPCSDEHKVSGV
jgi:hypothetical protein